VSVREIYAHKPIAPKGVGRYLLSRRSLKHVKVNDGMIPLQLECKK